MCIRLTKREISTVELTGWCLSCQKQPYFIGIYKNLDNKNVMMMMVMMMMMMMKKKKEKEKKIIFAGPKRGRPCRGFSIPVCLSDRMSVLTLNFKASHWPSDHMISSRPLIG